MLLEFTSDYGRRERCKWWQAIGKTYCAIATRGGVRAKQAGLTSTFAVVLENGPDDFSSIARSSS
jgi:hypothetical protein